MQAGHGLSALCRLATRTHQQCSGPQRTPEAGRPTCSGETPRTEGMMEATMNVMNVAATGTGAALICCRTPVCVFHSLAKAARKPSMARRLLARSGMGLENAMISAGAHRRRSW